MASKLRNYARTAMCRSESCKVDDDTKAMLAMKLGARGKNKSSGYDEIISLIGSMKESNVWGGSITGYFFRGTVDTKVRSGVTSYASSNKWQRTMGTRVIKYGTIIRGGKGNKKHLLIFGYHRKKQNKVYCSLTII